MGKLIAVHFDDILVYSQDQETHLDHLRKIFQTLRTYNLYANAKKCTFLHNQVTFLRFIVSSNRISAKQKKAKGILEWQILTNIYEVRSFHGLATLYRWFIRNFSSIMGFITNYMKKEEFMWIKEAQRSIQTIKELMIQAPTLRLPNLCKVLQVACDA
ncbi:unnamed protein product [Spirodela intermedia]|uniref:Reverse transcriptase domain-containing protein n=1 Tax=Spirodela intermedia TaxID=51605 RepID=A0A7I8L5K2_SPIIN|nr:unnamed protein product [Spirodela intermedia]